jgi:peroxiredoxin
MLILVVLAPTLTPGCGSTATPVPSPTPTESIEPTSPPPSATPASTLTPEGEPTTTEATRNPADLPPLPRVGHPAPDFTLYDLDGEQVTLSDLRGQVVVVNFWATWCMPCRVEMPEFEIVYNKWKDQGMVILGVNVFEDPSRVSSAAEEMGITFPVLLDGDGLVAQSYELLGYPTTYLIDRDGIIRGVQIGQISGAALETGIKRVL